MPKKAGAKNEEYDLGIQSDYVGLGVVYETRNFITEVMNQPERLVEIARDSYVHKNGFVKAHSRTERWSKEASALLPSRCQGR